MIGNTAYADNQVVKLSLKAIKPEKTQEATGDELYLDLLTYGEGQKPRHLRIPSKPHYWLSAMLQKVKDVPLLSASLKDKQSLTVIVSLMEKDTPPWNVNDLLGGFVLTLKRAGGVLYAISGVSEPEKRFKPLSAGIAPQVMAGGGAKYILYFSLN